MRMYVKQLQVGSCNCTTKTNDASFHKEWYKYRKLDNDIETFDKFIVSMQREGSPPLPKIDGQYVHEDFNHMFIAYCQELIV